jgi:hypothetical protein
VAETFHVGQYRHQHHDHTGAGVPATLLPPATSSGGGTTVKSYCVLHPALCSHINPISRP